MAGVAILATEMNIAAILNMVAPLSQVPLVLSAITIAHAAMGTGKSTSELIPRRTLSNLRTLPQAYTQSKVV